MTAPARRAVAVAELAERVALWNEVRTDDFQDLVAREVNAGREHFRDAEGALPAAGSDALYDALEAIAIEADASEVAVRDACAAALAAADDVRAKRT